MASLFNEAGCWSEQRSCFLLPARVEYLFVCACVCACVCVYGCHVAMVVGTKVVVLVRVVGSEVV